MKKYCPFCKTLTNCWEDVVLKEFTCCKCGKEFKHGVFGKQTTLIYILKKKLKQENDLLVEVTGKIGEGMGSHIDLLDKRLERVFE